MRPSYVETAYPQSSITGNNRRKNDRLFGKLKAENAARFFGRPKQWFRANPKTGYSSEILPFLYLSAIWLLRLSFFLFIAVFFTFLPQTHPPTKPTGRSGSRKSRTGVHTYSYAPEGEWRRGSPQEVGDETV